MNAAKSFLLSTKNLTWVGIAVVLIIAHSTIHLLVPAFNPPWAGKPGWIQWSLKTELLLHIVFLGAFITGIRNMIPMLKRPSYSDAGLLDIGSQSQLPEDNTQWVGIALIVVEFSAYLALWGWTYGIFR